MSDIPPDTALIETRGEISLEWKIKNFRSLPKNSEFYINSTCFLMFDSDWCLQILPNDIDENIEVVSIYLILKKKFSLQTYQVSATLGIKKADDSVCESYSFDFDYDDQKHGYGSFGIMNVSDLMKPNNILTEEGTLTVFCTARILNSPALKSTSQTIVKSVETLSQNLKELYLSKRHRDVTINVGDQAFQAHKSILSARSRVFASMLELDMAEKKSGEINIDDCDPESFQDFLLFLYSGELDQDRTVNACALYKTADKYDVKDLMEQCTDRISSELSIDTICDAVLIATLYDDSKMFNICTKFFIKNLKSILITPQWTAFLSKHPTVANELFLKLASKMDG